MFSILKPHLQLASVLELDAHRLRSLGLDGLLLDVDCTLKDYRVNVFRPEVIAWVRELRAEEIRLCLVSNGRSWRIEPLARMLDLPYVAQACKPLPFGCKAAIKKLGLDRKQAGFVGDQIFSDVLAGRLAGLFTILVRPIKPEEEPWFTRLKRPLERRVLSWMNSSASCEVISPGLWPGFSAESSAEPPPKVGANWATGTIHKEPVLS